MERQDSFEKYAIVQIGAHQYQAIEGKTVAVNKIDGEAGASIEFKEVLLKKDQNNIQVGTPFVKTTVTATIVKQMKGPKLIIFRFKRRKKSRVKKGHRQSLTVIRFTSL